MGTALLTAASVAAFLNLWKQVPKVGDEAGQHRALRLNQGRRASDRLTVVAGLPQVDADEWPLDEPLPHPAETERRAV